MVCIGNMLGFYPPAFWPDLSAKSNDGGLCIHREFTLGPTSAALNAIRDQITIIQGLEHGTSGGHFSIHTFLSGVRHIDAKSMPMGNVTIDQFAAEQIPGQTRFPTLTIGDETGIHGGCQISWTKTGTRVPPIPGPEQLFEKLFVQIDLFSFVFVSFYRVVRLFLTNGDDDLRLFIRKRIRNGSAMPIDGIQ